MLQKGPLHLEQRIYDFVLPGDIPATSVVSSYDEACVWVEVNWSFQ